MSFIPRTLFPNLDSIPRSYFLGHHKAGLSKMTTLLSQINLVIECRDYRVPLTSRNPLFEQSLGGRERMIVYTKRDLGSCFSTDDSKREETIRKWHRPSQVVFTDHRNKHDVRDLLDTIWTHSQREMSLTGSRMMVVGMPNVGKSSLLNALRKEGLGKAKAARTGAQPGVTRKIATSVKIILGNEKSEGVYLLDTPGVFVPYVPDAEAMLRLALCGSVKDTIVHPTTLADYLLFHMNKVDAGLYEQYCPPTNDIRELLSAVATKTGRLQKGGTPDLEASALWIIQRWRNGHLGRFVLDEVSEDALADYSDASANAAPSMTQARKAFKDMQRQKSKSSTVSAG